jgi:hypothetical protein
MVRVHSGLPFQVVAAFSACDFLPVFAVFRGTSGTMKWHIISCQRVLYCARSLWVARARALTLNCTGGVFNFS